MLSKFQSVDRFVSGASMPKSAEDIAWLKKQGIKSIVSLDEMPKKAAEAAKQAGMKVLHLPLDDTMPPSKREVHSFLKFVNSNVRQRKKVFIHCYRGVGRTREMLAFYLIGKGMQPLWAHSVVGTVETPEQKRFLLEYGEKLSRALKRIKTRKPQKKPPRRKLRK